MHASPTDVIGIDSARAYYANYLTGFSNITFTIKDVFGQGEKLVKRFYPHCYWHLLHSLDTHHIGRGRGTMEDALGKLNMMATIIAIDSDQLIPAAQQMFLAVHMPLTSFHILHSPYGHDGFLIETDQINKLLDNSIPV